MPQHTWSAKRERQYMHIKSGLKRRGRKRASEIAAWAVNKARARSGEARRTSPSSFRGPSPGRRGGLRSHGGPGGRTKDELYTEAKKLRIRVRSAAALSVDGASGLALVRL